MIQERAVLAGGCFWGMQDLIRKLPGVHKTRVGYTGGDVPNATYRNHGSHAEGIEILFNPDEISYRRILEFFFRYMIQPPPAGRAMIVARLIVRRFTTLMTFRNKRRSIRLPTSMPQACGRARS